MMKFKLIKTYGTFRYFADNEAAKRHLDSMNRKSMFLNELENLKKAGYELEIIE